VLPTQLKSTECCCGATPVPDSVTLAGEFVALLTNDAEPEAGPLTPGAKLIATVFVPPAAIVSGKLSPDALKTPPVKLAAVTVTELPPVFVSVTFWLAVFPSSTLPKEMLVGETESNRLVETATVAEAVFVVSAALFAVTV
jgi:hypothetical protein